MRLVLGTAYHVQAYRHDTGCLPTLDEVLVYCNSEQTQGLVHIGRTQTQLGGHLFSSGDITMDVITTIRGIADISFFPMMSALDSPVGLPVCHFGW